MTVHSTFAAEQKNEKRTPKRTAQAASASKARPRAAASAAAAPRTTAGSYAERPEAAAFAVELAGREGLDLEWVQRALGQARRQPSIERAVLPPPAGTPKNWAAYRARFVEPVRIDAGIRFWRAHEALLDRVARDTGVPAAIIVGIIGVETLYGRHMGNFAVLDALATLAFDFPAAHPRAADRSTYFRGELGAFLVQQQRSGSDPAKARGSYAGAMGMPQFMPGSVARFAVDGDGDGRIDLAGSVPDVVASVANYFIAHGWKTGLPTHLPAALGNVSATSLQTLLVPDILPTFSAAQLREHGVALSETADRLDTRYALVELQNGAEPPSHVLGTENFYVVTRYNWSSYYALAVIELGEAVLARMQR